MGVMEKKIADMQILVLMIMATLGLYAPCMSALPSNLRAELSTYEPTKSSIADMHAVPDTQVAGLIAPLAATSMVRDFAQNRVAQESVPGDAVLHMLSDDEQKGVLRGTCDGTSTPIPDVPNYTITTPGSYHLTDHRTVNIAIEESGVCLDLGSFKLTGTIRINAPNAKITAVSSASPGIEAPAATNNTLALEPAVDITANGTGAQLIDLKINCNTLPDVTVNDPSSNLINGRLAFRNAGHAVSIINCQINAAHGQTYSRNAAENITLKKNTGSGGVGISNSGSELFIQSSIIRAGNGGNATLQTNSESTTVLIDPCISGAGGVGISNNGEKLIIKQCFIYGGKSGDIIATNSSSTYTISIVKISNSHSSNGGSGVFNTALFVILSDSKVYAGSSGNLNASNFTTPFFSFVTSSIGTSSTGDGGVGVLNQGSDLLLKNTEIVAGISGLCQAIRSCSSIQASTGAGGIGVLNSGDNVQIYACSIRAASSGKLSVASFGQSAAYLYPSTINSGGHGIVNSGSNCVFSQINITASDGGITNVSAGVNKYGSANGGNGGHGIWCTGSTKNVCIVECLIEKSGRGGAGFRGVDFSAGGDGGNGGNGFTIDSSCGNVQIQECRVVELGSGGTSVGGSSGVNGKMLSDGLACSTPAKSLIFSCNTPLTVPRNIYYFAKE